MKIKMLAVCRKDKMNKAGTAPIHIRFTHDRKIRYVSTGFAIDPVDWDFENGRVKTPLMHLKETQHAIEQQMLDFERRMKRLEALDISLSFDTLFEKNGKRANYTVGDYFQAQIDRLRGAGKIASATKYRFCLAALSQCSPVNIRFEQVDMAYLRDFETFLLGKANASNSVATKFSVLKAVYNRAIADGVFEPRDNPFAKFKVGKYWKPTRKRAITKEDVLKIKALELPAG